jgi:hypothetical protein
MVSQAVDEKKDQMVGRGQPVEPGGAQAPISQSLHQADEALSARLYQTSTREGFLQSHSAGFCQTSVAAFLDDPRIAERLQRRFPKAVAENGWRDDPRAWPEEPLQ